MKKIMFTYIYKIVFLIRYSLYKDKNRSFAYFLTLMTKYELDKTTFKMKFINQVKITKQNLNSS